MQLKTEIKSYFPATEFAGVFITAFSVTFCYILTAIQGGNEPVYKYLIFFATLCFYSTDHFFDVLKYAVRENIPASYKVLYRTVSVISGLVAMIVVARLWQYHSVLIDFIPAIFSAVAYILIFRRKEVFFLVVRLLLVAITASLIVYSGNANRGYVGGFNLPVFCSIFLVMLMNVIVSIQLDQLKDQQLGNLNLFNLMNRNHVNWLRYSVGFIIVITAVVFAVYSDNFRLAAGSILYTLLMIPVAAYYEKLPHGLYRIIPDFLLPLAFLPLW